VIIRTAIAIAIIIAVVGSAERPLTTRDASFEMSKNPWSFTQR
jgi:hypothetical protein